jgi:hypothetical protein
MERREAIFWLRHFSKCRLVFDSLNVNGNRVRRSSSVSAALIHANDLLNARF